MISEDRNKYFDATISKISSIPGTDYIYFLDDNYKIIKEQKLLGTNSYLEQILNILKSETLFERVGDKLYTNTFHTYTFLNENGLIVISKLKYEKNLYLVVIAGENEPVDLINLLKICKESRLGFNNQLKTV